jgi:hypothetical protein
MEKLMKYYHLNKKFLLLELARLLKRLTAPKIDIICLFLLTLYAAGLAHAGPLEQKLIDAAFMGKVEIARSLIDQGADVNARDESGNTILLTAVRPYGTGMVKLLVDSGADISAKDQFGFTPLAVAVKNNHTDIAKYLKEKGATK